MIFYDDKFLFPCKGLPGNNTNKVTHSLGLRVCPGIASYVYQPLATPNKLVDCQTSMMTRHKSTALSLARRVARSVPHKHMPGIDVNHDWLVTSKVSN